MNSPMYDEAKQAPADSNSIDPMDFLGRAKELVLAYVRSHLNKSDSPVNFNIDGVYIVWFCKTLNNWKALLSTTLPDGMYYEVTHDGFMSLDYFDAYKNTQNVAVPVSVAPSEFFN